MRSQSRCGAGATQMFLRKPFLTREDSRQGISAVGAARETADLGAVTSLANDFPRTAESGRTAGTRFPVRCRQAERAFPWACRQSGASGIPNPGGAIAVPVAGYLPEGFPPSSHPLRMRTCRASIGALSQGHGARRSSLFGSTRLSSGIGDQHCSPSRPDELWRWTRSRALKRLFRPCAEPPGSFNPAGPGRMQAPC
jgi:hypothetical protein